MSDAINRTRAEAEAIAEEEIEEKKRLEKLMTAGLILFFTQLANDYEIIYASTGNVINLNESYVDELKSLLKQNYRKVADKFDKKTRDAIEATIDKAIYEAVPEIANQLKEEIGMAIGADNLKRANTIAPKIADTIQKQLTEKTAEKIKDLTARGIAIKNAEIASSVANEFTIWGIDHSPTISTTEVQAVAERSKYVEHISLTDLVEQEIGTQPMLEGTKKVWVTAGDERVRKSHSAIDGTVIDAREVFVTGMGGRMNYAGDTTLGASLSDVINCRCETIYRWSGNVVAVIKNKLYRRKAI